MQKKKITYSMFDFLSRYFYTFHDFVIHCYNTQKTDDKLILSFVKQ